MAKDVAVLGAGVMGRGIAFVAARAGHRVRLVDESHDVMASAVEWINQELQKAVNRGELEEELSQDIRDRTSTSTSISEACAGSDLVVEAVVESMEVKHDVLSAAEATAAEGALIATNTSALSITEVIGRLTDPSRGIGLHFFNPVHKMRLIEVVRGLQTSEETVIEAEAFGDSLGKVTVRISDSPGFATSRINALIGNEALRMLEAGIATAEDIDLAVRLGLNHPMGPLEMGDLVGWDTRLLILEYLEKTLGSRFRPTAMHRELVAAGRLGRKSGRGVHEYSDGRRAEQAGC